MAADLIPVTPKLGNVVRVFLLDPDVPHYVMDLMLKTGHGSGAVYVVLAHLETAGWLASHFEEPTAPGRARRRVYRITEVGVAAAHRSLAASPRYYPSGPERLVTRVVGWLGSVLRRH